VFSVSLVLVPKLLVTGSSGEGTEEVSYKTASKGYFTTYVVGLKVKGAKLVLRATRNNTDIYEVLGLVKGHRTVLSRRLLSRAL